MQPIITLLGAVVVAAVSLSSASASPTVDVIDGICAVPVKLVRFGELASWPTKQPLQQSVPFAVESEDTRAWLYVPGGQSQVNVDEAEFGELKLKYVEALRAAMPGLEVLDAPTALTVTAKQDEHTSWRGEALIVGLRVTLIGGCLISVILQKMGSGPHSDIVELLNLIELSN